MKEKETALLMLDNLLADQTIQDNPTLYQLFELGRKRVQNVQKEPELNMVLASISSDLSRYLMLHKYKAPQSSISCGYWVSKYPHKWQGFFPTLQMLAMSLLGMFK